MDTPESRARIAAYPPRRTASLRRLVLVALVSITLAWTLAQLFAVRGLVTRSYLEFERQDGLISARRLDGFLAGEIDRLLRMARDWGYWDDSLNFVEGRNPEYLAENLSETIYANLAVDLMLIGHADGRLLHQWTSTRHGPALGPAEMEAVLHRLLSRPEGRALPASRREISGVLRTSRGLLALAVVPILDNERNLAPAGVLVFGRDIDRELLDDAAKQSIVDAELFPAGASDWPADVARVWAGAAQRVSTAAVDAAHLGAYVLLDDLDGTPVGVLRSLEPRDTRQRLEQMGHYLLGISLLLAALIGIVALWVLERRVVSPIATISRVVGRVARDGDLEQRVPDSRRRDELAQLGREINLMLAEIANQQQLREARDRALAASAQKSAFLANMSHEIRTPMNGILGMLELVLETDLTSQQQERVQTASRSAKTLLALLNDILDLSKLEADQFQLEHREFQLREVVENVVTLFAPICEQKGIAISCYVDPALDRYLGDPLRVQQVLSNLLGNAVKFTARGEVSIAVSPGARADEVRFLIADTGIGIDADRLQVLFQPFAQADTSMARRYGGTGLGLAISRQLVERMQGRIEVTSEAGRGTRFTCHLRLQPAASGALPDRPHAGRCALVYGPGDGTRLALIGYLRALGFDVRHQLPTPASATIPLDGVALLAIDEAEAESASGLHKRAVAREVAVLRLSGFKRSMPGIAVATSREQILSKPILWHKLERALDAALQPSAAPSAVASTAATQAARIPSLTDLRGRRVLLVEDNAVNQTLALGMLETYDLVVDCAEDGGEALEKLAAARYDLVLMDCQMPGMDGLEATRRWRERETATAATRVPIVALTANAMSGDREICLAAGMDDYLAKPFSRAALTEVLRRWLAASAQTAMAATRAADCRLDVA